MTKKDYLNKLLNLCTKPQKDLFSRMYPEGPEKKQLDWATKQLENTLKDLNETNEELRAVKKAAKESSTQAEMEIVATKLKLEDVEEELRRACSMIERLKNPINIENNNIQERLDLLEALEGGGVDNWDGYDDAIEHYRYQGI